MESLQGWIDYPSRYTGERSMTIEEARKLLDLDERSDGFYRNKSGSDYVSWNIKSKIAILDGAFTADELEAMAIIMRVLGE